MTKDTPNQKDAPNQKDVTDSPSLRQRIASATGDRHAEAKALADRAGDAVGAAESEIAVREAHGDIASGSEDGATERRSPNELASVADAKTVRDRKSN